MNDTTTMITHQSLRSFGLIMASILALVFGLAVPLIAQKGIPAWPWIISMTFLLPSIFRPQILKHVYLFWMKLGLILGWVNTRIILSIIFYVLITPIGLLMRICGYNALHPKFDKSATSYFHLTNPRDPNHMERPF